MAVPRIKPAIALTEAEERDAYPHPGRRLSKYEMLDQEKPLPRVPVPVRGPSPRDLRRQPGIWMPSQMPGQPYPQLKSLLQTSAVWNSAMSTQDRRITDDTTYHSPSLHTSEMIPPQPLGRDNRASSFDRGASGSRSSKKINQLIGHDLDLPSVDPYTLHEDTSIYGADFSAGAPSSDPESGSESEEDEQCRLSLEEGLLPLLLEIDEECWLNRRDSWVPRTLETVHVPPPLNVGRQERLPSDGSVSPCNSEHSPTHPPGVNFRLSSETPVRWNPVYGQFTDRRAANDYHRFAAELATSCGSDKSRKPASSTLSKQHGSSGERLKKAKTTEKLRQASTAAITRLWDNARTKDARKQTSSTVSLAAYPPPPFAPPLRPLPPIPAAAPARVASPAPSLQEDTRKKHCPARLSAVGVPLPPPSPHRYTLFPRPSTPPPPPLPAMQFRTRQQTSATQNSVFDYGSDNGEATDDDEAGRGAGRRWWRRSDEGDCRSSSEWPAVQRIKCPENDKDNKPSPLSSGSDDKGKPAPPTSGDAKERASSAGGVKGLFANARDLALLSPAERRRTDLRKSIRVLRASEPVEPRASSEAASPKSKSKVVKPKKTRQIRAYSHRSYFHSVSPGVIM
ncbi:hypothetical protein BB8028_0003g06460 [Beauveria bassiana]|uniref:Uncharacterized protein n=1 Tax=Beauveria bassiana TaxID=176275 RepID=A0A2S7Y7H1_BEABA|nr:hypothetical protein BB8028_0003g06460 [Beauveria bassiana]